jgi:putative sporulation protein YyaC
MSILASPNGKGAVSLREHTERPLFRKKIKGDELAAFMQHIRDQGAQTDDLVFLCIGTDRSSGDALGPLVGMMLEEAGYPQVIGTLAYPFDASNMVERSREIPLEKTVIAIDACLGQPSSLAWYQVSNRPIEPGKSLGKLLPPLGDYSIAAIVNVDAGQKYSILQSTSLHRVMTMSRAIVAAIQEVFPVREHKTGGGTV